MTFTTIIARLPAQPTAQAIATAVEQATTPARARHRHTQAQLVNAICAHLGLGVAMMREVKHLLRIPHEVERVR